MRYATRIFLFSFIPFALLLMGSFWAIQRMAVVTVRDGLRVSLRKTQESMAKMAGRSELQNSRFLRVVAENPSLKAGMQLARLEGHTAEARRTLEDQLRELSDTLQFDILCVVDADGTPLAGVMRVDEQLVALDLAHVHPPEHGLWTPGDRIYQLTSIPVNTGNESIGTLSLGEQLNLADFPTPVVLEHDGHVLRSTLPGVSSTETEEALQKCPQQAECEVRLRGESYLSLPVASIAFGDGFLLRSFQNVDLASAPVQSILRNVFVVTSVGALLAALLLSLASSRSIVKPITAMISHLQESEQTGLLPEFLAKQPRIQEVRQLTENFNRAAASIREARERLHFAYVEFVGSLANALDARDRYTAGHSRRVSEFAVSTARSMQVPPTEAEEIRIGALLHDIGKIGIADAVLQKPGRLEPEEFELLQQHPAIGRRILEQVRGFEPYLPMVELHHENWDGSGYPHRLSGSQVPLGARIVHVVDAYDAMTTDRPYRPGMTHMEAIRLLERFAGIQFDPTVVAAFTSLPEIAERRSIESFPAEGIAKLSEAIREQVDPERVRRS